MDVTIFSSYFSLKTINMLVRVPAYKFKTEGYIKNQEHKKIIVAIKAPNLLTV